MDGTWQCEVTGRGCARQTTGDVRSEADVTAFWDDRALNEVDVSFVLLHVNRDEFFGASTPDWAKNYGGLFREISVRLRPLFT
jgi:hypothetical protein